MTSTANSASDVSLLSLARATERGYCQYAQQAKHNEFWWYFNGTALYRGFSRPSPGRDGRWWYRVKPGFAWPVDFFAPFADRTASPGKFGLFGWQFPVKENANSFVPMNVIHDLSGYGFEAVVENKRRAVRKGIRQLDVSVVDPGHATVCEQACEVWNSHVARTGWNRPMDVPAFARTWRELVNWPGTTVICAKPKNAAGPMCSWLIARAIDDTVYVDTIASHSDRLADRPNDAMIFVCLCSARALGMAHAHYSLCSDIVSLEDFKRSLGFVPHPFPARLHLRKPVEIALRALRPGIYRRLRGQGSIDGPT